MTVILPSPVAAERERKKNRHMFKKDETESDRPSEVLHKSFPPSFLPIRRWKWDDKLPFQSCPPLTCDYGSSHTLFSVTLSRTGILPLPPPLHTVTVCLGLRCLNISIIPWKAPWNMPVFRLLLLSSLAQVLLWSSHRSACGFAARHLVQSEWQGRAFGQEWQPVREVVDQQTHTAQPHRCLWHHRVPGRRTLQQSNGDFFNIYLLQIRQASSWNIHSLTPL